jgi:uncharacterized protein (DUF1810 family)
MENDLTRFLTAQERYYDRALEEIRKGKKESHWIWYIFPQLKGLGYSSNAAYYGIDDLQEASAYLQHPILGPRLILITKALLGHAGKTVTGIMGSPDDLKLRSSMTLFSLVPGADPVFSRCLRQFFGGELDDKTVSMVKSGQKGH